MIAIVIRLAFQDRIFIRLSSCDCYLLVLLYFVIVIRILFHDCSSLDCFAHLVIDGCFLVVIVVRLAIGDSRVVLSCRDC